MTKNSPVELLQSKLGSDREHASYFSHMYPYCSPVYERIAQKGASPRTRGTLSHGQASHAIAILRSQCGMRRSLGFWAPEPSEGRPLSIKVTRLTLLPLMSINFLLSAHRLITPYITSETCDAFSSSATFPWKRRHQVGSCRAKVIHQFSSVRVRNDRNSYEKQ